MGMKFLPRPSICKLGDAGTVKSRKKRKVGSHGCILLNVGDAAGHRDDMCLMWSSKTNKLSKIKDIDWLGHVFYKKKHKDNVSNHLMMITVGLAPIHYHKKGGKMHPPQASGA